jgi:hypothetical protein
MLPATKTDDWLIAVIPALLVTAVVGIGGLFVNTSRIDAGLTAIADDLRELKVETKSRLLDLEKRVRELERSKAN